jgi:hypothetical protein
MISKFVVVIPNAISHDSLKNCKPVKPQSSQNPSQTLALYGYYRPY